MFISLSEVQPLKAFSSIILTLFPIVTFCKLVQLENKLSLILIICHVLPLLSLYSSGIFIFVSSFLFCESLSIIPKLYSSSSVSSFSSVSSSKLFMTFILNVASFAIPSRDTITSVCPSLIFAVILPFSTVAISSFSTV